jgi:hypothetical protein
MSGQKRRKLASSEIATKAPTRVKIEAITP